MPKLNTRHHRFSLTLQDGGGKGEWPFSFTQDALIDENDSSFNGYSADALAFAYTDYLLGIESNGDDLITNIAEALEPPKNISDKDWDLFQEIAEEYFEDDDRKVAIIEGIDAHIGYIHRYLDRNNWDLEHGTLKNSIKIYKKSTDVKVKEGIYEEIYQLVLPGIEALGGLGNDLEADINNIIRDFIDFAYNYSK